MARRHDQLAFPQEHRRPVADPLAWVELVKLLPESGRTIVMDEIPGLGENQLRTLTGHQVVTMRSVFANGKFTHYEWRVN